MKLVALEGEKDRRNERMKKKWKDKVTERWRKGGGMRREETK